MERMALIEMKSYNSMEYASPPAVSVISIIKALSPAAIMDLMEMEQSGNDTSLGSILQSARNGCS